MCVYNLNIQIQNYNLLSNIMDLYAYYICEKKNLASYIEKYYFLMKLIIIVHTNIQCTKISENNESILTYGPPTYGLSLKLTM